MKNIIGVLITSLILFSSCGKGNESDGFEKSVADVIWYGDPAADGAGLWLKIKEANYKVTNEDNIAAKYKVNKTKVLVEFIKVGEVTYYTMAGPFKAEGVKVVRFIEF
ncbi:hypothetical protein NF867_02605 [Solitalea sp. MAHUQ-68]|uniref:Uncharacterized protein n=1 Tax=Solitalea agri TaxID=2953739 RepID=A0A9X2F095_9SPHI|nr:hypothetical protein [Solitalea agri]MCO4291750.1 hypothetical protein [Solitalea agri]